MTTSRPDAPDPGRRDLRAIRHSRWSQPLLAIFAGAILLAVLSIGGHPQEGPLAFGIMLVLAIVLLAGGRALGGATFLGSVLWQRSRG